MEAANDYQVLLLKTSWQAAVLIILVLGVQWLGGARLTPRLRHGLWLLVVFRLALPWTVPSATSLFNFLDFSKVCDVVASLRTIHSEENSPDVRPFSSLPPETSVAQTAMTPNPAPNLGINLNWFVLALVWATGALALAGYLVVMHWRLSYRVARCRPLIDAQVMNLLEDCKQLMGIRVPVSLVETAAVDGPCLFGFLRPRILLPPGFTSRFSLDELRYVFLHELGHIKRHDIPLGWLTAGLQIVHWFNPFVWLAFSRMCVDRELACDALVLSYVADKDNKPYGLTIVKLLESFGDSFRVPSLAGIVEDKQQIKERISMIAKHKKTNRGLALAAILAIALGLLTLTDAKSTKASAADQPAPPKIVSTSPKIGATDVNPKLTEITVTFDQDMGRGMSWTGGGPEFPTVPDDKKAKWRNKRTCVLPVKLEAGHFYRVGINSQSFQNFRSATGLSVPPSAIMFTTRGADDAARAKIAVPRIVRLEPPNGAKDVSPALAELRVTFDVPMGDGCSWCSLSDAAADYPKSPEGKSVHWTDDKLTCVLPVELKPGMTYHLSLNDPEYKNFQSADGVPLVRWHTPSKPPPTHSKQAHPQNPPCSLPVSRG